MSHNAKVKTKLRSRLYIKKALEEKGYNFKEVKNEEKLKTKSRFSSAPAVDVDLLITSKNGSSTKESFGFKEQADGTYAIVGDFYSTGVTEDMLQNEIAETSAKLQSSDKLTQMGFELQQQKTNKEMIELNYSRWVD